MPSPMPVGAIIPFGGPRTPEMRRQLAQQGWLFCDGLPLTDSLQLHALYLVIGTGFGQGYDPISGTRVGDFNLPDLRGRFVRGLDDEISGRDPDSDLRTAMIRGGNTGRNPGSVQGHATAFPSNDGFASSLAGEHSHDVEGAGKHVHRTEDAGEHHHQTGRNRGPNVPGPIALAGIRDQDTKYTDDNVTSDDGNHHHKISESGGHSHSLSTETAHSHTITGGDQETRPINAGLHWIISTGNAINLNEINVILLKNADGRTALDLPKDDESSGEATANKTKFSPASESAGTQDL